MTQFTKEKWLGKQVPCLLLQPILNTSHRLPIVLSNFIWEGYGYQSGGTALGLKEEPGKKFSCDRASKNPHNSLG